MLTAHAAGELIAAPERRTSERGTDWLRLKLRCAAGGGHAFVSVAVFDPALIERLADLLPGDSVSVAGPMELRAWLDREGQPAAGASMVANACLSVRDGTRKREARAVRQEAATWAA